MLLYCDDYKFVSCGADCLVDLLLSIFFLHILGVPFSFRKIRGGFSMEWVGYAMDYKRFAAGIAGSRSEWLIQNIELVVKSGGYFAEYVNSCASS